MYRLPLFIVGSPRSGTTLLRLMFNSHSEIAIPDETNIFGWIYERPFYKSFMPLRSKENQLLCKALGNKIVEEFDALPYIKRKNTKDIVDFLFGKYAEKCGKKYWGEKTPGHSKYITEIKDIYPRSTIIYMVRDPRAVVASSKRYTKQKRGGTKDFWMHSDISESIKMWKNSITPSMNNRDKVLFVLYETLVSKPEKVLRNITGNIGITYEETMLEYYKNSDENLAVKIDGEVAKWHKETLKKANTKNIDKWKKELSVDEIREIESRLEKYFTFFNYNKVII